MMKAVLCHLLLISLLFVSIDGAADMAREGHAHAEHAEQQESSDDPSNPDIDSNHCDRCCHGHAPGISSAVASSAVNNSATDHEHHHAPSIQNLGQAPPTPPPTA